jgi:hypothetical protein
MSRLFLILAAVVLPRAAMAQTKPATAVSAQTPVVKPITGPRQTVRYKGFTIDVTELASVADHDSLVKAVKGQLDLVANAKLPAATRTFFRTVPLVMQPVSGRARYGAGRIEIPLQSQAPYDRDHPILLHELCHAYHEAKLTNGFNNPTILAFYEQAKQSGKFPADSYMLSNHPEYFAMMASVFLNGSAVREPFGRDSIRVKQPAMYDWLVKEFGRR